MISLVALPWSCWDTETVAESKLTREEAVVFFLGQLAEHSKPPHHEQPSTRENGLTKGMYQIHYGKCELYDLIDAIYGPAGG